MTPLYIILGYARSLTPIDLTQASEILHLTPEELQQSEWLNRQPDKEIPYIRDYAWELFVSAGTNLPKWANNILKDVYERDNARYYFERDKKILDILNILVPSQEYSDWMDIIVRNYAEHVKENIWHWYYPLYQNARDLNVYLFNEWLNGFYFRIEGLNSDYIVIKYPGKMLNFNSVSNYPVFARNLLLVLLKDITLDGRIKLTFNPTKLTGKHLILDFRNISVGFLEF